MYMKTPYSSNHAMNNYNPTEKTKGIDTVFLPTTLKDNYDCFCFKYCDFKHVMYKQLHYA